MKQLSVCVHLITKISGWHKTYMKRHKLGVNTDCLTKIPATIIITCKDCSKKYLSVLLSRRSVTTGRIEVHKSSVIVSLFSIRTLAISAETCSNQESYNHQYADYSVHKKELPSTDRMITHLLHCRDNTPDVISIPHLMNNLHVREKSVFEKLHVKSISFIQICVLLHRATPQIIEIDCATLQSVH
jgi:hypothetical protein